ncbi:MAG: immunoglobulin domain-containing protein, partial [Anaerolineae bacterium]
SQTVSACGIATFDATVNGSRPFTYQWSKGGSPISGATNATFTIDPVKESDEGAYTLMVTNSFGTVTTSPATLTVNGDDSACTDPPSSSIPIYLPFIGR